MSICIFLDSALPLDETRKLISKAQELYGEILRYFWVSDGSNAKAHHCEEDAEYGFQPKCYFLIEWNKERSELLELIPDIFFEIFGKENILIRDNNYEVIPPP